VEDEKNKDKLSDSERTDALDKVKDVETWISQNPNAEKEEFDQKATEFKEGIAGIASKLGVGQPGEGGADYSGES